MTPRLPRRVPGEAGEPADSLLHRLGTRWGMSRDDFERFVGFGRSEMRRGAHVEALAAMAGVDAGALFAATPRREPGSRRMVVGAAWTDLSDMSGRRVRVCAECLHEDRRVASRASASTASAAWCRPEWSVRSIATCVRHGILLTSACPSCDRDLDGANPAVDVCACGAQIPAGTRPAFESAADALLVGMIAGVPEPMFAGAGLHQVSAHLTRLGAAARGWSEERAEAAGVELLAMRETGLALARGGARRLFEMLDTVLAQARPGGSGMGITSAYGWMWRSWLGVPTANPLDARLRGEVLRHASGRGIRSQREPRHVTLAQAGAILGSGHERTRRIVAGAGMLDGGELRGVGMALDGARVTAVATALAGLVDATAAAEMLGVGRHRFREVARAGLVKPDRHAAAIGAGDLFHPDAMRSLVDRVAGAAPLLDRFPANCVPVPRASRDASVPLTALLAAMLDGRLHAVARTPGAGLGSLWMSVTEARRLASPARSVRWAAGELGLHYEAARWLAAEGLLGDVAGVVDPDVVAAFGAAFCTTAQAGRELGMPVRAVIARLRAAGCAPTFGPPLCRQAIWRRKLLRTLGPGT